MQLTRVQIPEDAQDEDYIGWAAEWALRDEPVGTEDSNEDLQQLVDDIIDDARQQWADGDDLTVEWELSGDAPAGKTMQDMVAEAGVTLPTTVIGRGKDHPHAIRILARAWLYVIWHCWQDGIAYHPERS